MTTESWTTLIVGLLTGGAAAGSLWLGWQNARRAAAKDAVNGAIAQLNIEIQSLRRQLADLRERNARLEGRYAALEERFRECERDRTELLFEIHTLREGRNGDA